MTSQTSKDIIEAIVGGIIAVGLTVGSLMLIFQPDEEEVPVVEETETSEIDVVPYWPEVPYTYDNPQLQCLALNIYHEARSDNYAGRMAVADVTLNRVEHSRFPDTVCDVVQQAKLSQWHLDHGREVPLRHKCQFSWFCDGRGDEPRDEDCWQEAQLLAYNVLVNNELRGITEGATHYHATYVLPKWSKDRNMRLIGRIGAHIFYRQD